MTGDALEPFRRPGLALAVVVFALALWVWAQAVDQALPGSPLGLVNEASVSQQEVDAPANGETHWY